MQETLRLMQRPPTERLTEAVAREACQRQNVKAMLAGSIAPLGTAYVITVNATECATGRRLATEQVQAARREDVLAELGRGARSVREKLGESLATLERFDVPLERATTSSLDALKAFTTGFRLHISGQPQQAILHLERAVSLDPEFAFAYAQMSTSYFNLLDYGRARAFAARAYELRDRASERERFYIEAKYHDSVDWDLDRSRAVYELWSQTYPRDYVAWNNLGVIQGEFGDFDRSLENYAQAKHLHPGFALTHGNIAFALFGLNRLAEAKTVADETLVKFPTNTNAHVVRLTVACLERDTTKGEELLSSAGNGEWWRCRRRRSTAPFEMGGSPMRVPFSRRPRRCTARPGLSRAVGFSSRWDSRSGAWDTPIVHARWPPRQSDFCRSPPGRFVCQRSTRKLATVLVRNRFSTRWPPIIRERHTSRCRAPGSRRRSPSLERIHRPRSIICDQCSGSRGVGATSRCRERRRSCSRATPPPPWPTSNRLSTVHHRDRP